LRKQSHSTDHKFSIFWLCSPPVQKRIPDLPSEIRDNTTREVEWQPQNPVPQILANGNCIKHSIRKRKSPDFEIQNGFVDGDECEKWRKNGVRRAGGIEAE
jgi:hypothetical protein